MSRQPLPAGNRKNKNILMIVTALVWVAAIATSVGKFRLAAKAPVSVTLSTKPSSVRVLVNGQKQFDGAYVETPRQLTLAPGKSNIKISREGYISAAFSVDAIGGESINMTDVVLQKNADLQFQPLEVLTPEEDEPVYISLNNGFVTGETPVGTSDPVIGSTYILTAYPNWPDQEGSQRCRVRLPGGKSGDEAESVLKTDVHRVMIRRSAKNPGQLLFRGCDKLRAK
jgi:hypothetical protein